METLIQERIKTEQANTIWATMQKVWLQTWSASLKMHMLSRNSAKKLTSMYQITYVLFMHSLMFYDVTSDDVVAS